MRHAVAAAAAVVLPAFGMAEGWVWCACGRRFGLYDNDGLVSHIAKEDSVGTEK